jgi:uncharacterized protein YyaL (SSP411 family)
MPNRLAESASPYLRQHAHNPVDWWPWGAEAFAEARRRNVPIFLSAGYSTCYWCHVMERESFEDAATARLMNERLVCVKLDREERPEVDQAYMAAIQVLTGRGGWPMSIFLEPERLRPFWGGTYFPPEPRHGLPSFRQVVSGMSESWASRREDVLRQAGAVAEAVSEHLSARAGPVAVGRPQVAMAMQTLLTIADPVNGGFGGAPKFPQAVYLELLLDARARLGADQRPAIDHVLKLALDRMALGGIHDHLGGGFHRYSVDAAWMVPHFEKMLYDQAQMLSVYARAADVFGDGFYGRVARRIAGYVARELTHASGVFFTAQDAEVDGREGLNYLWAPGEIVAALPGVEAQFAMDLFGLTEGPNFSDPHHPDEPARNVLRLSERPEGLASRLGVSARELVDRVDRLSERLLGVRDARRGPRLDDKVLTSWNGLMMGALADAGRLLREPALVEAARRAAEALWSRHASEEGVLVHSTGGGRAAGDAGAAGMAGTLEDYAMFAHGLLAVARALPGEAPLRHRQAAVLLARAEQDFGDGSGGYFDTQADRADLFVRARATYDGAMPSAGSVITHALIELAEQTGAEDLSVAAARAVAAVSAPIAESPISAVNSTRALLRMLALDEPLLVSVLADAPLPASPGAGSAGGSGAVQVWASEEELEVGPEQPAEVRLRVEIAAGHHLMVPRGAAAAPVEDDIEPLVVSVVGGSGVAVFADYPEGEPIEPSDAASVRVYRGRVEFDVALEAAGTWTGAPRLAVRYQACTDRACLMPASQTLDVRIVNRPGATAPGS